MVRIQLWTVVAAFGLIGTVSAAQEKPAAGEEQKAASEEKEAAGEIEASSETDSPPEEESSSDEAEATVAQAEEAPEPESNPSPAETPAAEPSKKAETDTAPESPTAEAEAAAVTEGSPEASSDAENASEESAVPSEKKSLKVPRRGKRPKLISVGLSAPLCGFAEGLITGSGWVNTSSEFIWGNLDVRFLVRMAKRFALGGGFTQSLVFFEDTVTLGGAFVADLRWYAVTDYLYFKLNLYVGFPLLFALGPTMGHSFEITPKVHLYIENQFILMVAAGAYGFWQPAVGAEIRF